MLGRFYNVSIIKQEKEDDEAVRTCLREIQAFDNFTLFEAACVQKECKAYDDSSPGVHKLEAFCNLIYYHQHLCISKYLHRMSTYFYVLEKKSLIFFALWVRRCSMLSMSHSLYLCNSIPDDIILPCLLEALMCCELGLKTIVESSFV